MALIDKKSMLDRNLKGEEGNPVGQNPPSSGTFYTDNGASNSPFDNEDHLKALLEDTVVNSQNSGNVYDPSLMIGKQPGPPAGDQDFDGLQGPQFQRGTDVASQVHNSSLSVVPKSPSNSPFQDRIDANESTTPTGYIDNLPS